MGTDKRERQKAGRAARVEAAQVAQKRAESRRRVAWIVGTVAFVAVILLCLFPGIATTMPDLLMGAR
jgi:hypothetical protein